MTKEPKAADGPQTYAQVVERLEGVVKRLEGGELPLEESLKAFEEGIRLVKRGESLLTQAEGRIEQLLEADGELKEVPLAPEGPPRAVASRGKAEDKDEDVPF